MQSSAPLAAAIRFRLRVQEPRSNVKVTDGEREEERKREGDSLSFSDPPSKHPGLADHLFGSLQVAGNRSTWEGTDERDYI